MFSGIVEAKGKISLIKEFDDYLSIEISAPNGFNKNLKKFFMLDIFLATVGLVKSFFDR